MKSARVKKACVNWIIPSKMVATATHDNRIISINRGVFENGVLGLTKNIKSGESVLGYEDFSLPLKNINVSDEVRKNKIFYLARFVNGGVLCNLYMCEDKKTGEIMPFVTMTSRDRRFFLLISNNSFKDYEIYKDRGYYIGYVPYNVNGFKFVTLGQLSEDSQLPIYIKSGKIVFNRDNENISYDAMNYYLFSDKSNEIIDYRRLYSVRTKDYNFIIKYSNILFDKRGEFVIKKDYFTEDGKLDVSKLRHLKKYDKASGEAGGILSVNNIYQVNILCNHEKTGERRAVGFSYVRVSV